MTARRVRRRRCVAIVATAVVLVAGVVALKAGRTHKAPAGPPCWGTADNVNYALDLEQASTATTIAAIGKRMGLANHAVTIALAAALQESGLHNLNHGDRDSLGLFQQRPSQGWGTAAQIMNPRHATTAFYGRLTRVPGWQDLSVTEAAQRVQRSAAPDAYAEWEAEARVLARAMTGEVGTGLRCRFALPKPPLLNADLTTAASAELGSPTFGVDLTGARGWTVATWIVGHAQQYRVRKVAFAGQVWTPMSGRWIADPSPPSAAQTIMVA